MSAFLTVAFIHFLAMVSPGPDFVLVTRNSLVYSRRTGIYTAAGMGLGIMLHAAYCLLGIGLVISQSIVLYSAIKYLGALYLIYIGWKSLRSKAHEPTEIEAKKSMQELSMWEGLRNGFLCNALNPKATVFVLALFTQVIDPETPLYVQAGYGLYMGTMNFAWFSFLASIFSIESIKLFFGRIQKYVERVMGAILIALGVKVALSRN